MSTETHYLEVISGERKGLGASTARGALWAASGIYRTLIGVRNAYYGRWAFPKWLDCPVISVGNLTAGGTGKTPMTLWICERLIERGRKPAVLSRGYRSENGVADELVLMSRRLPSIVAIGNPDRVAAGQLAVQEYHATAAVLDDGFQHRRMGRDLDLVLIDATRPFGFGHVLPRGLLREGLRSLGRAEAVVITRADQVSPEELARLEARLKQLAPLAPVVKAIHRPGGFWNLLGAPGEVQPGTRVGAFAGIARPDTFVRTLASLGHAPAGKQWFPDHHAYPADDVAALVDWAKRERLDALVTTEKDAVKLEAGAFEGMPVHVLRVDMALLDGGDKILTDLIDEMLKDHEGPHEPASA